MYLDNAATTPLKQCVKDRIISMLDMYSNPSSVYQSGMDMKNILENARDTTAKFINAESEEIIFTSSGSAANTLGITGFENRWSVHLHSPTGHKSLTKANDYMNGIKLKVDKKGFLDIEYLEEILQSCKEKYFQCLVSFEYANSEIGTINHVKEINNLVHKYNGITLVDCTGSIPYIPLDVKDIDCDMATFSAHKLGALKGCGVLYKKKDIKLKPLVFGSQEQGLFAGTENILGIVSLEEAIKNHIYKDIESESNERDTLRYLLKEDIDCAMIGADFEERLPKNFFLCIDKVDGQKLVSLLDTMHDIQISTGSACNNYNSTPSPTLLAIGMNSKYINNCIRITFGESLSMDEIKYIADSIIECVNILKEM